MKQSTGLPRLEASSQRKHFMPTGTGGRLAQRFYLYGLDSCVSFIMYFERACWMIPLEFDDTPWIVFLDLEKGLACDRQWRYPLSLSSHQLLSRL